MTLLDAKQTDYDFEGWYSDSNFVSKITRIVKGDTGNIILYALWTDAVMTLIPSKDCSFSMGANIGASDETPIHTVTFTYNYWMDTTEVTQGDYLSLMGFNPSYFSTVPNGPVESVTYFDAILYCNKRSKRDGLDTIYTYTSKIMFGNNCTEMNGIKIDYSKPGYRLPTEAEWEYACRAGTTTDYYWESNINNYAWYMTNSGSTTHTVAQKLPNNFGLYDMSGNVYEWCNDFYSYNYLPGIQIDPIGPSTGGARIIRSGSWDIVDIYTRSAEREYSGDYKIEKNIGFRCARKK
jgi:uncharacterized repeat protein (TIGR02543 family)